MPALDLLRRGLRLEYATLAWNVVGVAVLGWSAARTGSPALAGFGLDSLVEIAASLVVVWQLTGTAADREERAMRLIGAAFAGLVVYVLAQSAYVLSVGGRPQPSALGIGWVAATAAVMTALAAGKLRTGAALGNPVLRSEGRVTLVDAYLAAAVLAGLVLSATLRWWAADPLAALVIVGYGVREARHGLTYRSGAAG